MVLRSHFSPYIIDNSLSEVTSRDIGMKSKPQIFPRNLAFDSNPCLAGVGLWQVTKAIV